MSTKQSNTYPGGKNGSGTIHQFINLIPECDVLGELFAGSAALAKNMNLPALTIINEINPGQFAKLQTDHNAPGIIVMNSDAISFLQTMASLINYCVMGPGLRIHLYLDPPYPHSERKDLKLYKNEMSDQDHIALLEVIRSLKCTIQISSYKNKLYDNYLSTWNQHSFQSMTRQGVKTETIYYNYQVPDRLQDYRYLGKNFRQRELIKKRTTNLISKINRLPPPEKNRLLQLISGTMVEKTNPS